MEAGRFDAAVRILAGSPTRRHFIGLVVGPLLAAHLSGASAWAKGGHGSHRHHNHNPKRKNKRKKKVSSQCPPKYEFCQAGQGQSNAGEYSQCCSTATDPSSGDPYEICTDCGCCPAGNSQCCPSAGDGLCCPNGSKCSYAADFSRSGCCAPDDQVCFGGCCDARDVCCTMDDGTPYCCSGAEGLTCKKSGGPTCVKA